MKKEPQSVHTSWALLLVLFFCLMAVQVGWADEPVDSALRERFLQEAPSKWEEYVQRVKQLQGTCVFSFTGTRNNMKGQNVNELKMNDHCKLIQRSMQRTWDGKTDYDTHGVTGSNPQYAFRLHQKTGGTGWVVMQLADCRRNGVPKEIEDSLHDWDACVNELVRIRSELLVEVIRRPEFRVISCRAIQQGEDNLVEVKFDCAHPLPERDSSVQGGTLVLDPQRFWCLHSYDVRLGNTTWQGTRKFQVEEWGEVGDPPVPFARRDSTDHHSTSAEGPSHQVLIDENELSIPHTLPSDNEFTLTAFGLPEPPGSEWPKRSWPLYLSVSAVGIACLAAAIVLRSLRKRMAQARTAH